MIDNKHTACLWLLSEIGEFHSESGRKSNKNILWGHLKSFLVLNKSVCNTYCALKFLTYIEKLFSETASGVPFPSSVFVIQVPNLRHFAQLLREISFGYSLIYCCLIYLYSITFKSCMMKQSSFCQLPTKAHRDRPDERECNHFFISRGL